MACVIHILKQLLCYRVDVWLVRRRLHVEQGDAAVTLTPNLARRYQKNRQAGLYGKHERMHTEIEGRSKIVQRRVWLVLMQDESTSLHDAAARKSLADVYRLLKSGASIHARNEVCNCNVQH
jgi:hypothetical protein